MGKADCLERRFYYFFSLPLARLLKDTRISPDQVSLLSLLTGLAGIAFFLPGYGYPAIAAGVVLLNLSNILDAADGQLARARGEYSPAGWYLDDLFDRVKVIALFAAFSLRLGQAGALLCLIGLGAYFALNHLEAYSARQLVRQAARPRAYSAGSGTPRAFPAYACLSRLTGFLRDSCRLGFITVGEIYLLISVAMLTGHHILFAGVIAGYCVAALLLVTSLHIAKVMFMSARLAQARAANEPVYVFGAGAGSRELIAGLQQQGCAITAILDSNPALAGREVADLRVMLPAALASPCGLFLIGSLYHADIRRQLLALGVRPQDIVAA